MTPEALKAAVAEAERFLRAAKKVKSEPYVLWDGSKDTTFGNGTTRGAVKRASLDLTRALADMRRL